MALIRRGRARLAVALAMLLGLSTTAISPISADTPLSAAHLSHGRFKTIAVYTAAGPTKSFALLLADAGEKNSDAAALARELASHGAMTAIIDVAELKASFEADPADCVFPDGDFENLSHFLQAYYHLTTYLTPFLLALDSTSSLAYATLVQAPANTFAAALTLEFCPTLPLHKPLCKGSGAEFAPGTGASVEALPAAHVENPWVVIEDGRMHSCPVEARDFAAKIRGAASVALPQRRPSSAAAWIAPFSAAYDTLVARTSAQLAPLPPAALGDLPVIEVAAQAAPATNADSFAIIMSGDGGWAGLDKEVAEALSAAGIPVVGLDSLRYFWTPRTPEGLAADTDRMIRYYLARFRKQRVLLIGYSQGADVLPFAVNRLPSATRSRIGLSALMGMSEHALFEFHVSSWISNSNAGPSTLPEVDRMSGAPVLCIYGEDDADTLCPKLDPHKVRVVKLKGGHHFNGDYAGLAREILAASHP